MDNLSPPADASPAEVALVDDVFGLLTYHLNRSRDPGLYLSPADMERQSATAQRMTDWFGQPDVSTVLEMGSDSTAAADTPVSDAASGTESI